MSVTVIGSDGIETTPEANYEIISEAPSNWTFPYQLKEFAFMNDNETVIKVNGGNPVYLRAGQGFSYSSRNSTDTISSFVVVTQGTSYNWLGVY